MQKPIEVCLRHLADEHRELIEATVHTRAKKLERFVSVIGCHVTVDRPQRAPRSRSPYRVVIRLTAAPNRELVVRFHPADLHGSVVEIVDGAFDAMERRLKEFAAKRGGFIKAHSRGYEPPVDRMVRAVLDDVRSPG